MKRIAIILFVVLLSLVQHLSAYADSYNATLTGGSSFDEDGNIVVNALIENVSVKDGIISFEYDIEYDSSVLEIVDIKYNLPERWVSLLENVGVESFSYEKSKGCFHWAYAVVAIGEGFKSDDEFGISITFKPLTQDKTSVVFKYIDLRGEIINNGKTEEFVKVACNDLDISVNIDDHGSTDNYENSNVLTILISVSVILVAIAVCLFVLLKGRSKND